MTRLPVPDEVRFILNRLYSHRYDGYMVGGCVRDALMSKWPNDYDLCTDATPDEVKRIFPEIRLIETGLKHGTLTLLLSDKKYELTTYRTEGSYSDNRRPDNVCFVADLKEDLRRRDFTVNAIAYSERDGIVDPFDGSEDIKSGLIRAVGEPSERFREDALRIMRALRFASTLKFAIEEKTSSALFKQVDLLQNISPERLNGELSRLILGDDAVVILLKYREILARFIPELVPTSDLCHLYEHSVCALGHAPRDVVVRLALLLHGIDEPQSFTAHQQKNGAVSADAILRRLHYSNATTQKVCELILHHQTPPDADRKAVKMLLLKLGEEQFYRLLELNAADMKAICFPGEICIAERLALIEEVRTTAAEIIASKNCPSIADLAVNGDDLISLGFVEGKEIGRILSKLHEKVLNETLPNDKMVLIDYLLQV